MQESSLPRRIPIDRRVSQFSHNLAKCSTKKIIHSIQRRCISMLAKLWNKRGDDDLFGTATTGSSEAIMLAGLAMKRSWLEKHPYIHQRPNIIIGSNVHVCATRFAEYFDVESKVIPVNGSSGGVFDGSSLEGLVDHKTSRLNILVSTA